MKTSLAPVLVWLRQDLRLADNPALHAAVQSGAPVIVLYIYDETLPWQPGGASKWWLHHSLQSLHNTLQQKYGAALNIIKNEALEILPRLVTEHAISHVYWNRCYEPATIARDKTLKTTLSDICTVETFNAALLHEPWEVKNKEGGWYKVFTPFWKASSSLPVREVLPEPATMQTLMLEENLPLNSLHLLPNLNWAKDFTNHWTPGAHGAWQKLQDFLDTGINGYKELRNRPDLKNTSRLSPHLHFGEISPVQIWHETHAHAAKNTLVEKDVAHFLSEIGWREFSYNLLYYVPTLPEKPLREEFADFPWGDNPGALKKWQRGQTGYPIVDAAMRELWHSGWMHNRTRMIVASFLIKDLLIPWQDGEAWFWDTLVDADLASNSASWQWVAGCGADAAPYFRIFNPITQGEKFDPNGEYIRRWIPELKTLPNNLIHKPWEATAFELAQAGIQLGKDYPHPMVDHAKARQYALQAYETIKKSAA